MHTLSNWIYSDIMSVPSIDIEELEAMIAAEAVATTQKSGARQARRKRDAGGTR